jgi:hypothetical protein
VGRGSRRLGSRVRDGWPLQCACTSLLAVGAVVTTSDSRQQTTDNTPSASAGIVKPLSPVANIAAPCML